ncbi:MAG: NTP transferase domain-containing protein, partial [Gammaproteobacteria bacterium]|nr:NTP transferase domain-containing protein [Gammaproteobacteria bacterium]
MKFSVIIPARFASERLPGKPLLDIGGKPMIWHTWQRAIESGAERLVIATDDSRIESAAVGFGAEVIMTGEQHRTGTDRVAEAAARLALAEDEVIVNLQCDEPLMPPRLIRQAAETLFHQPNAKLATLATVVHSVKEFL